MCCNARNCPYLRPAPRTSCAAEGRAILCQLGDLAGGSTATIDITLIASQGGTIDNTVSLSSAQTGKIADALAQSDAESTAEDFAVTASADLSLRLSEATDTYKINQLLQYDLNVVNDGPSTASDIRLNSILPADMVLAGLDARQGSCEQTGQSLHCALGFLPPNRNLALTLSFTPTSNVPLTLTLVASAPEIDENNANNRIETVSVYDPVPNRPPWWVLGLLALPFVSLFIFHHLERRKR